MKIFLRTWLTLAGLLGLGFSGAAQTLANLNFETWATRNGVEAPTNWQTSDDYVYALLVQQGYPVRVPTGAVAKTTTAHGGTYAASLTTKTIPVSTTPFPGLVILGTRLGPGLLGGNAYPNRPAQLQFYYQFNGPAADSAAAQIFFTYTNPLTGQYTIVGQGIAFLQPTTSSYVLQSLPITYSSSVAPDSVRMAFFSGVGRNRTANSTLLVDDVALVGPALSVRADAGVQAALTVSPNPSPGGRFVLHSPDQPELAGAPLLVTDALGHQVLRQPAQTGPTGTRELDLSSLSPGLYLMRLDSKQGAIVRQLTIK